MTQEDQTDAREGAIKIIAIALQILNGELEVEEGAIQLVEVSNSCSIDLYVTEEDASQDYSVFRDIAHMSSLMPRGPSRQNWNAAALRRKDELFDAYLEEEREEVLDACKALIGIYQE